MGNQSTAEFVDRCLQGLLELPFVRAAERVPGDSKQIRIRVRTPRTETILPSEIHRSHLGRESARFLVQMAKGSPGLVVLAPAVSPELGDQFERSGVNFVDLSGNCHLKLGEEYIGRVQGRKSPPRKPSDQGWRAASYKVLFALIARPGLLQASARELGAVADVSAQTANAVRNRLIDQGLALQTYRHRTWAPNVFSQLLSLWVSGFASTLAPNLLVGRFRARKAEAVALERQLEPLLDAACNWRYGGAAAAYRMTGYYRGDRTVIYMERPPRQVAARLKLVPDRDGPITLARRVNEVSFSSSTSRCVHPLLAYSDLLSENHDRAHEAAQVLYDSHLQQLAEEF